MITDREAARMRAEEVFNELNGKLHRALNSGKANVGQVLHTELPAAAYEMLQRICAIYAKLDGAAEPPLADELTNVAADRVVAFVKSTVAGVRGHNAAAVARIAANIEARVRMGAGGTFKLAAYDAHKDKVKIQPPPPAPLPKVDEDAHAAFDRLPIHPEIRVVCGQQFADGHYREAVLNAGIALVEYVKRRAGNPLDKKGAPLDGTPLMQWVFGSPILKVNDLKDTTDQDEQQGMQFLFSGTTLGLRNPRAHSLDKDTAEYAVEAVALISFLYKIAEAAKT